MEQTDVFSVLRYLDIKSLTIGEMEHLKDLFRIKEKQIDEEIRKRKREGKE